MRHARGFFLLASLFAIFVFPSTAAAQSETSKRLYVGFSFIEPAPFAAGAQAAIELPANDRLSVIVGGAYLRVGPHNNFGGYNTESVGGGIKWTLKKMNQNEIFLLALAGLVFDGDTNFAATPGVGFQRHVNDGFAIFATAGFGLISYGGDPQVGVQVTVGVSKRLGR